MAKFAPGIQKDLSDILCLRYCKTLILLTCFKLVFSFLHRTIVWRNQNDTQNMDSMLEFIRPILIARTGSPAISVPNYQAGSIAMLPAYQRLQMDYEASGNYVTQNINQYEAAMKKFEDILEMESRANRRRKIKYV
ncbi:Uncharacterised protein [Coprococcus eutactus]|nr:Uncharacterised protein [Coprococcus eutactus]